jgi:hypothetical protein
VTNSLGSYLLARYQEIEQVARAAAGKDAPSWRADDQGEVFAVRDLQDPERCEHHTAGVPNHCDDVPVASGADVTDDAGLEQARAEHIAMQDPAAVLRDVEAKRRIVKLHGDQHECPDPASWEYPYVGCETLKLLAQQLADRDDFREEWRL